MRFIHGVTLGFAVMTFVTLVFFRFTPGYITLVGLSVLAALSSFRAITQDASK